MDACGVVRRVPQLVGLSRVASEQQEIHHERRKVVSNQRKQSLKHTEIIKCPLPFVLDYSLNDHITIFFLKKNVHCECTWQWCLYIKCNMCTRDEVAGTRHNLNIKKKVFYAYKNKSPIQRAWGGLVSWQWQTIFHCRKWIGSFKRLQEASCMSRRFSWHPPLIMASLRRHYAMETLADSIYA